MTIFWTTTNWPIVASAMKKLRWVAAHRAFAHNNMCQIMLTSWWTGTLGSTKPNQHIANAILPSGHWPLYPGPFLGAHWSLHQSNFCPIDLYATLKQLLSFLVLGWVNWSTIVTLSTRSPATPRTTSQRIIFGEASLWKPKAYILQMSWNLL